MNNEKHKVILLVEGEASVSISKAMTLEKHDYKVITANTGEEAIKIINKTSNIDMVLMDINLGKGMDGTQTAEIILEKHTLPIIFLSSHTEREVVQRTEGISSYGYIVKDSGEMVLVASIKMAFRLFDARMKEKEKEEEYRLLFENASSGIFIAQDGKIKICNPALLKITDYPADVLLSKPFTSFIHPDDIAMVVDHYEKRLAGETVEINYPFRIIHATGDIKWVELSATLTSWKDQPATLNYIIDITERKRAEDNLRKSEERYRNILDSIEESYFEVDLKGNLMFFNDTLVKHLGYTIEETLGMNFRKFVDKENRKKVLGVFHQVFLTGETIKELDWEIVNKKGARIAVESSVILRKDVKGKPVGFRGVVRDITKRKEAEEALRRSEEKYRTILETMEEGLLENDLKGNYTFVNDAACRLHRYQRDEFIGMNYRKLFSPETARQVGEVFKKIYETGEPAFMIDIEVIRKDGSVRIHESNAALMRDPSGKPIGFRNLVRDVTERKKAEHDLKQNEEKYRTILESMEEGLFEVDLRGNFTFVNDAACRLNGYQRDEFMGMNYRKLYPPETARQIKEVFKKIFETGEPAFMIDTEVIRKDGSVRIHESNAALMRDLSGKPIGFCNLVRDVTERKKAEEEKAKIEKQLFQAQKMEAVGSLAGGVAHDFNNMLTVILGYTELIKSRLPQDDSLLNDMLEIEKAAGRSKELTRQLLAFSRKEIIVPKLIDLNGLIVGEEKMLSRLLGEDIDLRFYPGKDIWKIKFDSSQMELVLINLAANARDAMPNGGKLTIETENIQLNEEYCRVHIGFSPGDYVLLGVSDNGMGMDKEIMQHVFEPFFTTKEIGKGTGLGLATVYGIVKQNRGFINVYSEPGKGTTFKMYIPRSLEEGEVKKEAEEVLIASGTGTVLLVEDEDMVRKITTEMLEAIGYTTLSVGTPMEALSLFKNDVAHIDLVITDVVMPQISGRELSDRIKAIRPGVNVLFMSGYTTNVIAHQGILDEGVHFIQKPFSLNDLARKVNDAIKDK